MQRANVVIRVTHKSFNEREGRREASSVSISAPENLIMTMDDGLVARAERIAYFSATLECIMKSAGQTQDG
jgi:hypothetical protein